MTFDEAQDLIKVKAPNDLVQELLFDGHIPHCFNGDLNKYREFRQKICEGFKIHPQNFAIVGSAKTGFSLNPSPRKGRFGKEFDETSDIDVVIVSEEIFQSLWLQLLDFQKNTLYKLDYKKKENFRELQFILFWGLIRFDKLSNEFPFARSWWEFFNELSTDEAYGPRRVRAAFYKSWYHAALYYEKGFSDIQGKISENESIR